MGQEVRGVPEASPLGAGSAPEEPIGPYLARQRRLRGISLEDLSARTKIPVRSLERLESGAFDAAPDGFSRGFVRAVAEALGLDVDDAVMRLLREPDPEEAAARRPRQGGVPLALAALLLAAVSLLGLFAWGLSTWLEREPASSEPPVVYRRDAVRELADEPPPPEPSGSPESLGAPEAAP